MQLHLFDRVSFMNYVDPFKKKYISLGVRHIFPQKLDKIQAVIYPIYAFIIYNNEFSIEKKRYDN